MNKFFLTFSFCISFFMAVSASAASDGATSTTPPTANTTASTTANAQPTTTTKSKPKTATIANSTATNAQVAPTPAGEMLLIKDGSIEFFAIGKPSMLKIHGESTKMSGTMNRADGNLSGVLEIPLDSFETGMSVRNNHLKEKVFETSKFTTAKLTISSLAIPAGQKGEIKNLPFTGKLSLHGVEKDISGTASVDVSGKTVGFTADFQMKMSDYQIPPPEFMGMSMQDDVKVSAKGEAKSSS